MVNLEELSNDAMLVITYAGMAKTNYIEALRAIKEKNEEIFQTKLKEGDHNFLEAQKSHMEVLQREMQTNEPQMSILMCHAEDQLMFAELIKTIVIELKDVLLKG